jgi:GT2 family glycosyltransferase
MDTLIVVVSYNDAENTLATVASLIGQGRVVVWDNASTDDTVQRLGTTVDMHVSHENVLWTPACNGAVREFIRDEKYILFSNNDIVYRPNVVERLKQAIDEGYGIVAPTGTCLGGLQDYATQWGHGRPAGIVDHLPTLRTAYLVGASMMMSEQVWDRVGEFDEDMPLGADDHDYCIRAKDAGYRLAVVNSAYVNHKGHASAKHAGDVWAEWGGKSWGVFNEKWAGYFHDEEEALKCHWSADYYEGWDYGTGWLPEEKRTVIAERRAALSDPR